MGCPLGSAVTCATRVKTRVTNLEPNGNGVWWLWLFVIVCGCYRLLSVVVGGCRWLSVVVGGLWFVVVVRTYNLTDEFVLTRQWVHIILGAMSLWT